MYLYQALPWKLISNYLCIHFVRYAISTCICTTLSQLATSKLEFLLVIGFNICSMLYTKSLGTKNKTWGLCLMMKQGFILKIHRAFPSSKLSAHDLHTFSSGNINHRESWHVYYIHSCLLD